MSAFDWLIGKFYATDSRILFLFVVRIIMFPPIAIVFSSGTFFCARFSVCNNQPKKVNPKVNFN